MLWARSPMIRRTYLRTSAALIGFGLFFAACATSPSSRSDPTKGHRIAQLAKKQLGVKYTFGGNHPTRGFDCSGLAWWTHRQSGLQIPRQSFRQYKKGERVGRKKLQPGDLLFFTTYKRGPSHVGIYQGQGRFVHAPRFGKAIRSDALSDPYWAKRYLGARRYY